MKYIIYTIFIRNYVFERLIILQSKGPQGIVFLDGMRNMKFPTDNQV